jgi:hypothetical protein
MKTLNEYMGYDLNPNRPVTIRDNNVSRDEIIGKAKDLIKLVDSGKFDNLKGNDIDDISNSLTYCLSYFEGK